MDLLDILYNFLDKGGQGLPRKGFPHMVSKFLDKQGQVGHVIKFVYILLVIPVCAQQALRWK